MFSKLHNRLGTAGLAVAVVALVVALAGTAFAAAGLNSTQKKEVKKIAKQFAGKEGPQGQPGQSGAKGDPGAAGAPGKNGNDGVSPVGVAFSGEKGSCKSGGVEYKGANTVVVCNGQSGFTEVLPEGETETGVWSANLQEGESKTVEISFPIPLLESLPLTAAELVKPAETTANCPGSAAAPEAEPGTLCVYASALAGSGTVTTSFLDPSKGFAVGVGPTGTLFAVGASGGPVTAFGTWAVSAS